MSRPVHHRPFTLTWLSLLLLIFNFVNVPLVSTVSLTFILVRLSGYCHLFRVFVHPTIVIILRRLISSISAELSSPTRHFSHPLPACTSRRSIQFFACFHTSWENSPSCRITPAPNELQSFSFEWDITLGSLTYLEQRRATRLV